MAVVDNKYSLAVAVQKLLRQIPLYFVDDARNPPLAGCDNTFLRQADILWVAKDLSIVNVFRSPHCIFQAKDTGAQEEP